MMQHISALTEARMVNRLMALKNCYSWPTLLSGLDAAATAFRKPPSGEGGPHLSLHPFIQQRKILKYS